MYRKTRNLQKCGMKNLIMNKCVQVKIGVSFENLEIIKFHATHVHETCQRDITILHDSCTSLNPLIWKNHSHSTQVQHIKQVIVTLLYEIFHLMHVSGRKKIIRFKARQINPAVDT